MPIIRNQSYQLHQNESFQMKTKSIIFGIFTCIFFFTSCNKSVDVTAEKEAITQTIKQFYQSFESEDINLMSAVMAHDDDMLSFGTALGDLHESWGMWEKAHLAQFEALDDIVLTSKNLHVYTNPSATTAWFADVSDWSLAVQGEPLSLNNVRITGVLDKREGAWKIVQIHASVPQEE